MLVNSHCCGSYKWIRISVSNCIRAKSRHVLKTEIAVEPIREFESQIVVAEVHNLAISETAAHVCNRTLKWIRISDSKYMISSCLKTAPAVETINGFESRSVIAYVQNLDISENSGGSRAPPAVETINGFESRSVIAYVQNLDISENSGCSRARKWIRISDRNCIVQKSRHVLKTETAVQSISEFESKLAIA
ncbi:hypothetical protein CEXT_314581 [Caerostris extrusa]|uniref:Uncharacterized protein n=1 Tax=Caerostris extrusa TaxID=172846 RepID=A0AAV4MR11_CAEEX|nr:hypothetical protein CEXT_314581 [Caerostris extrusa]